MAQEVRRGGIGSRFREPLCRSIASRPDLAWHIGSDHLNESSALC